MQRAALATILLLAQPARAQAPADGRVVWQSNRLDNQNEIYIGAADGTGVKRLTTTGAQRPSFAPDGRWISFRGFNTDEQATFLVRPDGSERKKIFDGPPLFWLHDNSGVVSEKQGGYYRVDPDSGVSTLLIRASDFTQVAGHTLLPGGVTHDGRWLLAGTDLYREGHSGDNGSFKASFAAVVLDLQHPERVYFFGDGCWPFTPPAGQLIYHICGDCPTKPDIYRMDLTDLMTRASCAPEKAQPDADWGHEYNPDISNDNQWVAYMASTGCHAGYICDYEIFLHRLGAPVDQRVRVTNDTHFDGYPSVHIGTPWSATRPWLTAVPSRMTFTTPAPQRVTLHNSGSGTLEPVSFTTQYAVAKQGWLTVKRTGSGNDQALTVTADPAGLGAGQHQATIEARAEGAASPPARIEVTLEVSGCPGGGPCITELPVYAASEGCNLTHRSGQPLGGGAPTALLLLALLLAGWRGSSRFRS